MPHNNQTQRDEELREFVDAELGGFVLWTDGTPFSDEPTELEYFIKAFQNGNAIWQRLVGEVSGLIKAKQQEGEK